MPSFALGVTRNHTIFATMKQGFFKDLSAYNKLVLLFLFVVSGILIGSAITVLLAQFVFGIDLSIPGILNSNLPLLQAAQIFQSICIFILPSALASYLLYSTNKTILPGTGSVNIITILLTLLIIFLSQGFISWTGWINQQLSLPDTFESITSWIQNKELEAKELTDLMIQSSSYAQFGITIFMLCILPAIGEEWLFRGLIQKEIGSIVGNIHIAIIVTAFVFSAIHIQFLSFLPRFVLGIILGYLMVFSKNIWIPIVAHFFNNLMAVTFYITKQNNNSDTSIFELPGDNPFGIIVLISGALTLGLLLLIKQLGTNSNN